MTPPPLGVVIVTFNAQDVIRDCLESLLAARGVCLDIVVVDNASTDSTLVCLRDWASGVRPYTVPSDMPFALLPAPKPVTLHAPADPADPADRTGHRITLIPAGVNAGFAAGVNLGLALLAERGAAERFWILNPDSAVPPGTAAAFATCDQPAFALMGGRVIYYDAPGIIQTDGGTIDRRTGITGSLNQYRAAADTAAPAPGAVDFVTGASMVASRAFYDAAGPMPEDYFLYYEEVDWALRRGDLPLVRCPDAVVYHRAGTAIGSGGMNRPATAFAQYFLHRARIRFVRRHLPRARAGALCHSLAKAAQLTLKGYRSEARALLLASLGRPPPAAIRRALSDQAARHAFGPDPRD